MPHDWQRLRRLVDEVGAFAIRDRGLAREQHRMHEALLAAERQGAPVDDRLITAYQQAVRRYFTGFHREARSHLQAIDRRLEELAQAEFNATAERGVAVRRIERTQAVLTTLDQIDHA